MLNYVKLETVKIRDKRKTGLKNCFWTRIIM